MEKTTVFNKIVTRTVLATVAVATLASLSVTDAKAWVVYRTWHYYYAPRAYFGPVGGCVPGHFNWAGYWIPAHCW